MTQLTDAISWQRLEGLENFEFKVLHVDDDQQRADVLFRFAAGQPIILHRHCSLNKTLVIQGEHIIYEMDGSIREVRPTGRHTVIQPDECPHRESGGAEEDALVLFSIYNTEKAGPLYELLNEEKHVIGQLTMTDVVNLYELGKDQSP